MFSSVNMFEFLVPSRRDDLIALCYMLVYLFNDGKVAYKVENQMSKNDIFLYIKRTKQNMTV